jgi:hypothetical protein
LGLLHKRALANFPRWFANEVRADGGACGWSVVAVAFFGEGVVGVDDATAHQ